MAKSLFSPRKILLCLKDLRSVISLGRSRDCSTTFATYLAVPCWKSRIEASLCKRALSSSMHEAQTAAAVSWSPLLSASVADLVCRPHCCLDPLWGSTSLGGMFFPISITSFPFFSHFLLWSARSARWVGTGERGGSLSMLTFQEHPSPAGIPAILVGSTSASIESPSRLIR